MSLAEVMAQDARVDDNLPEQNERQRDYREISNYRRALRQGRELVAGNQPLSSAIIRQLHAILLASVRGQDRSPGEFRRKGVLIGRPGVVKYRPPGYQSVPGLIDNLIAYINNPGQHNALVRTAIFHYQFEAIHPFEDGNGRTGRLLLPLYLQQQGLLAQPNLYLSGFFEEYKRGYVLYLRGVDNELNWGEWLEFFLAGVRYQAKRQKQKIDRIEALYRHRRESLSLVGSKYASEVLDLLFVQPFVTVATVYRRTSIASHQTASNLIGKFTEAGLLSAIDGRSRRGQLYVFRELVDLLEKKPDPDTDPGIFDL